MKGFHLSKTKFLLAASAASFMLALGCNPSTASAAGGETLKVTYDIQGDSVDVGNLKFYTTSKPGKTAAPATNRWIRTTDGTVSLSNIPNATTLYFADSTSPAVEDIVSVSIPALPKISSVKYYPVELDKAMKTNASAKSGADYSAALRKAFIFNTSVKYKDGAKVKTASVRIDPSLVQVKFNENSTWQDFDTAMTQANLKGILRDGATMYARVKPSPAKSQGGTTGTTIEGKLPEKADDPRIYSFETNLTLTSMFKDAKGGEFSGTSNILKEGLVRYGLPKAFKIPRLAAAPAVSVDYANHVITLKKGMNYKTAAGWDEFEEATTVYQDKALDATKKISLGDVKGIYAVRVDATATKAESLENYLVIPDAEKLATDSGVMITGTDGQNATLTIVDSKWNTGVNDEDKKKTLISKAYQYAIIKAADIDKVITKGTGTATFKYDTDVMIAWKTVKTSTKTGMAKATLPWNKANDCYVVVRKAADVKKKVFSSEVEVFKAPKAEETAVNVWEKLTLTNYADKGFTSNNNVVKNPFATVEYKGDKVFEITLLHSKVKKLPTAEGEKFTAKIGKDVKTVALADSSKDIDITSGKVSVKVDGITEADAVTATFTLPAPADATKADDTKYVAFAPITQTLKVDTKASKVESIEAKDGKFTMVVAGDVALKNSGKLEAVSGSKTLTQLGIDSIKVGSTDLDANMGTLNVSYNAKTKKTTFTGEYTSTAASGTVTVAFKQASDTTMKDMGGNNLDTTKNTGSYTKKEEATPAS